MDKGFAGPGGVGWALDDGERGTGGRDDYSWMGGWDAGWEGGGSGCHGVCWVWVQAGVYALLLGAEQWLDNKQDG